MTFTLFLAVLSFLLFAAFLGVTMVRADEAARKMIALKSNWKLDYSRASRKTTTPVSLSAHA